MTTRSEDIVRRRSRGGFSLLEITLVLVIIGLLLAGAAVAIGPAFLRAQERTTRTGMQTIKQQIEAYRLNNSALPERLEQLVPGFIENQSGLQDGWGTAFSYIPYGPGGAIEYDLISAGPDKVFETADDLSIHDEEATG